MSLTTTSPSKKPPASRSTSTSPEDDEQSSIDEGGGQIQLFLGGSCNPTTWRQTVAIPFLEMNGISYYNPQVDNWTPDAVKTERHAKKSAQVLLFVIDKQTRSTVSLVESAYMAGDSKKLVLVIYPFDFDVLSILDATNQTTSNVIETRSELTKTSLSTMSKKQINSSSVLKSSSTSSSSTTISSTVKHASGTIKMHNETISLREFFELRRARLILHNLIAKQNTPIFSDIPQALYYVSECLVRDKNSGKQQSLISELARPTDQNPGTVKCDSITIHSIQEPTILTNQNTLKDVYLSFEDDDSSNLEPMVLLMLREKGLTYNYRPFKNITDGKQTNHKPISSGDNTVSLKHDQKELERFSEILNACDESSTRLALEREMDAIHSSRVLLFVITNRCRGLSIMVLASHFMALFRNNVVLCIQYLEEPCSIDGENLSENAIADYNRGRLYLCDHAVKSKVPVFRTIREAVDCCSQKCRHNNTIKN